jgi:hypothetical protein
MKVELLHWQEGRTEFGPPASTVDPDVDLVLYFGERQLLAEHPPYRALRHRFPRAQFVGCSSGGQIFQNYVSQAPLVVAAIRFAATRIRVVDMDIAAPEQSLEIGRLIGSELKAPELAGVMVFSDGLNVNGSALTEGLAGAVGAPVPIVGGLAADGERFQSTLIGVNERMGPNRVAAVGLYGKAIRVGHGTDSGFVTFGPRRRITRSHGNVLYELDGKPALDLYKRYLGDEARTLPGSALHFPLLVWHPDDPASAVVRAVLAIDSRQHSLTFAGSVPQGHAAQLMRSTLERLASGAGNAARLAHSRNEQAELALLVSCIGRRLVMGQRFEAEIDAVQEALGRQLPFLGFYSYGEICPSALDGPPLLHNETMTIAVLSEEVA